jgi:SAM-dependent methyltransferase
VLTVRYEVLSLQPGELVLDLGCGAGRHSFEALRRGAYVVAADIDDAVLKDVRAWMTAMIDEEGGPGSKGAGSAGTGSGAQASVNAYDLPFPDDSFDRVIVSEVFEHLPEDERALAEVRRVLRPGGSVAITVPRMWPELVCWGLSPEYHSNEGGHVRIYRRGQLLRRARRAGLIPYARHHAHALHSPYWWLKCLVGVRRDEAWLPSTYHRFLVWDIMKPHRWVSRLERALDPLMGKSMAIYFRKDGTYAD